ncbi:TonB-dependent receptor domain-containing protein [Aestuariivivens sediminicola]|uniref:TonB-dependent receptor domain-containing protein n=1 Tax=Aestuariivivens sediminicola TaxID=2913560 RepID=UPI001F59F8AB|nr:TonB-dependent receptor [Aestuariivivens sediminicola]
MKIFCSLALSLFILSSVHADPENYKNRTVKGTVIDKDNKLPLEYATISFYSITKQKMVDGTITDINGNFEIKVSEDIYNIKIEYISYSPIEFKNRKIDSDIDLGTIELSINLESLDEVEVIAERTTVEIRLDKKIYNVGKDLTVRGGNVSDVLDNVPSVSVDAEGNIALRGNENVRILINGKPSGLVGLDSSDALKQLPAEAIEKVEVITSPSARYEAEGTAGILNIILRRSKLLGLNGAVTANVGHPDRAGVSGNINFRTGQVNLFNTLSYRYNESPGLWYTYTTFKNSGNVNDEKRDWIDTSKGITNNLGIEWYINETSSITTAMVYSDNSGDRNSTNRLLQYDSNGNLLSENLRLDPQLNDSKNIQYSFNYTKDFKNDGHRLTFDFQFEDNNNDEFSLINVDGIDTDILTQLVDNSKIFLRTDYVLPIGENSQFEMGYRGDYDDSVTDYKVELLNENTGEFEIDRGLTNVFNFRNYIHAAYMQFGSKKNKFSYLLGLRMENTQLTLDQPTSGDFEKRNFTGLFPSINLTYEFDENESLTFGYNRRLRRPYSFFLNPYPNRSSLTNIFQGNPGLIPTYTGSFDLGYLNRFNNFVLTSSIYYQHSINVIKFISRETGETVNIDGQPIPVILRGPANIATEDRYGLEFNLSYSPNRKWRVNTDFNIYNSIIEGNFEDTNFDSENLTWNIRLNNKLTLPGMIDWQTNINYRGPSEDAQNRRDGVFSANLAFSKDLFKEKASLAFNISDLFNSRAYTGQVETEDFINDREIRYRGVRTYNLSFTYRFNQKKKRTFQRNFDGGDMEM